MARGTLNKVLLIGRLGQTPEMQYAPSGVAVATFSIATNFRQKNQEGNWEDKTEWTRVKAFAKTAEIAGEYLDKGKLVYVEGTLRTRSWEDQNGQKKYSTEVICSDLQFLGGKSDTSNKEVAEEKITSSPEKEKKETKTKKDDDDLPF